VKRDDLTGKRYEKLVVVGLANVVNGHTIWTCHCDCGKVVALRGVNLKTGDTKSCGCWHRQRIRETIGTHLQTGSPEYRSWISMKARCENRKYHHYHRYGGRGITICERWRLSFEDFLADMGLRPSLQYTLDRKDNDGNYEPGNCQWATKLEQRHNRNDFKKVTA